MRASIGQGHETASEWRLHRATERDVDALYELVCVPEVYRYLADGAAPPRWRAEEWIGLNRTEPVSAGQGLWLLEDGTGGLRGCTSLEADDRPRTAELIYVLHPEVWGRGLATRMSWTVVEHAFRNGSVDRIVAGADEPNRASIAVMQRLGMRHLRAVEYPLGPGVEYVLLRDDPAPDPLPAPIMLRPDD